ncbi:CRISPR-associated endonuclease Cas2 [Candidatus Berkelbacteria bacterium RBG_13_40_8]|uniref:CRISPR-associated endonuclease Cas2 n=1 Tax=Candidatus Berkelbacteria bacterium RBG_13_40_8 TaxID=1797467 RepID=A0A1F5DM23_9BACT|nr:MAG: CRISPR-associated endonuclease Cas2 [Candidatus Berkelbacteria bacterium RBG_13_40_8]
MDEIKLEKTKILVRQLLLYFIDFHRVILPLFDKARFYRIPFKAYDKFREDDKIKFSKDWYRLKRAGFVKEYIKDKEKYIELTPKGQKQLKWFLIDELKISKPNEWDKKWRLVIFDIPNDKKVARNILRDKLNHLGFLKLQESVYVYPFECFAEIDLLRNLYFVKPYVQYLVADRIETEINLIENFYDSGLLKEK